MILAFAETLEIVFFPSFGNKAKVKLLLEVESWK